MTGQRRQRLSMAAWVQGAVATLRGVSAGWWMLAMLAMLVVIGVTLLRLATAATPAALAAGIVQLIALLLLHYLLYRAAAGVRPVLAVAAPLLRFGIALVATILVMLVPLAVARALLPAGARLADVWLWSFVATTVGTLILWPLAPWLAALATGDRTLGPEGSWRLLRGRLATFCGAYLMIVSPCFAVHLMLTMVLDAPGSTLAGSALIAVVFVDALASLAQLALTVGLAVAAWRLHAARGAR